ncbi:MULTISPECIES: ATP-binding protein [Mesorhizobium]|uniref:ATP-binding protein n=2 Tax=Phyllobacteriaceae TaxID=69277 RepID=UPI002477D620|nr:MULTISPECIES: ATP-binding protein [Mesorhizobium]
MGEWTGKFGAAYARQIRRIPKAPSTTLARLDGRFPRLIHKLTRAQLLILDDFGTHSLTDQQRFHLFELVEERYRRKSTLITAQVPVARWHDLSAELECFMMHLSLIAWSVAVGVEVYRSGRWKG